MFNGITIRIPIRAVSSAGRAAGFYPIGRAFESHTAHHILKPHISYEIRGFFIAYDLCPQSFPDKRICFLKL